MQNIYEFISFMDKVFRYCNCNSGGKVAKLKTELSTLTKTLHLEKNSAWYEFCITHDKQTDVCKYFNLPIEMRIKKNGHELLKYNKKVTVKLLDMAFHAPLPITITEIKKNKHIKAALNNRLLAKWINESLYKHNFNYVNDTLCSLWSKKGESFESLFKAKTLQQQVNILKPFERMNRYNLTGVKSFINNIKHLNIKGNFNKMLDDAYNYNKALLTANLHSLDKIWIPFSNDEKEQKVFDAFLKIKGFAHPIDDCFKRGVSIYEWHDYCMKCLKECLIYKYSMKGNKK